MHERSVTVGKDHSENWKPDFLFLQFSQSKYKTDKKVVISCNVSFPPPERCVEAFTMYLPHRKLKNRIVKSNKMLRTVSSSNHNLLFKIKMCCCCDLNLRTCFVFLSHTQRKIYGYYAQDYRARIWNCHSNKDYSTPVSLNMAHLTKYGAPRFHRAVIK